MKTRTKVAIGSILFLIVYWLLLCWMAAPPERYELTPKQERIIAAAWKYHGSYPAVLYGDSIYLESPKGKIWIYRAGR